MNKTDLKNGMVVETREGNRYMVVGDKFMRTEGFLHISDYSSDLLMKCPLDDDYDIVKVFEAVSFFIMVKETNKILWTRQAPVKELTVEEIEAKLGYKVKVVGG